MGRTACTEPQCLYKGALYLLSSDKWSYVGWWKLKFQIRLLGFSTLQWARYVRRTNKMHTFH